MTLSRITLNVILPLCSRSRTLHETHYVTDKAETDDLYETETNYAPEEVDNVAYGTSSHHEVPMKENVARAHDTPHNQVLMNKNAVYGIRANEIPEVMMLQ